MSRFKATFGALVLAQTAHSVEEYVGQLWESFPPARVLTGAITSDREVGFLVINVALVAFGVWCLAWPVWRNWPSAVPLATAWALLEILNGAAHLAWSVRQGGYTPGVATAPVLLLMGLSLWSQARAVERRAG
jgi:lysylphosphatidylglycerol synthetase-like protein (DUF2156 family)